MGVNHREVSYGFNLYNIIENDNSNQYASNSIIEQIKSVEDLFTFVHQSNLWSLRRTYDSMIKLNRKDLFEDDALQLFNKLENSNISKYKGSDIPLLSVEDNRISLTYYITLQAHGVILKISFSKEGQYNIYFRCNGAISNEDGQSKYHNLIFLFNIGAIRSNFKMDDIRCNDMFNLSWIEMELSSTNKSDFDSLLGYIGDALDVTMINYQNQSSLVSELQWIIKEESNLDDEFFRRNGYYHNLMLLSILDNNPPLYKRVMKVQESLSKECPKLRNHIYFGEMLSIVGKVYVVDSLVKVVIDYKSNILDVGSCDVDDKLSLAIVKILESPGNSIEELDFSFSSFSYETMEPLLNTLTSGNCKLKSLSFNYNIIDSSILQLLANVSKHKDSNLKRLTLDYSTIDNDGLLAVKRILTNGSLKEFSMISLRGRKEQSLKVIFNALEYPNCGLEELDVRFNFIDEEGVLALVKALKSPNCKLKTLNIDDTSISGKKSVVIMNALKSNSNLEVLNFQDNIIDNNGLIALTEALESCNLTHINIIGSCTSFRDEEIQLLIDSLKNPNCKVTEMKVTHNPNSTFQSRIDQAIEERLTKQSKDTTPDTDTVQNPVTIKLQEQAGITK